MILALMYLTFILLLDDAIAAEELAIAETESVEYDSGVGLEVNGFDIELDTGEGTKPETPIITPEIASSMDVNRLTAFKVDDKAGIGMIDA